MYNGHISKIQYFYAYIHENMWVFMLCVFMLAFITIVIMTHTTQNRNTLNDTTYPKSKTITHLKQIRIEA